MVDSRSLRALLPHPVRRLPANLAAVLVVVAVANVAVLAPVIRETLVIKRDNYERRSVVGRHDDMQQAIERISLKSFPTIVRVY